MPEVVNLRTHMIFDHNQNLLPNWKEFFLLLK